MFVIIILVGLFLFECEVFLLSYTNSKNSCDGAVLDTFLLVNKGLGIALLTLSGIFLVVYGSTMVIMIGIFLVVYGSIMVIIK